MPESAISTIERELRKDLGRKGIDANSAKYWKQKSHSLEDFYETETLDFEVIKKVGNKSIIENVKKDIILVKDPTELIRHICNKREMIMEDMCVRIGIDGGQASLKVVMNIFDPDNPDQVSSDGQKFTGVNKMIVLALVKRYS